MQAIRSAGSTLSARFLGYDFFISYSRDDASAYGLVLAKELRVLGYTCFFDTSDLTPGQRLKPSLSRALSRTSVLILLGTPGVLASRYVKEEIELFRNRGRRRRRLLPINIDRALIGSNYAGAEEAIWLNEERQYLQKARPSREVLLGIQQSLKLRKRQSLESAIVFALALVLFAMSLGVFWFALESLGNARKASQEAALARAVSADWLQSLDSVKSEIQEKLRLASELKKSTEMAATEAQARLAESARAQRAAERLRFVSILATARSLTDAAAGLSIISEMPADEFDAIDFLEARSIVERGHSTATLSFESPVDDAGFLLRDSLAFLATDGALQLWSPDGRGKPLLLRDDTHYVTSILRPFSGSSVFAGSWADGARLWDLDFPSKPVRSFFGAEDLEDFSLSRDGRRVAAYSWATVLLWENRDASNLVRSHEFESIITKAQVSPDGEYVAAAVFEEGLYLVSDAGDEPRKLPIGDGEITCLDWSPDANTLLVGHNLGAILWSMKEHAIVREISYPNGVESCKFEREGEYIRVVSDSVLQVRHADEGRWTWEVGEFGSSYGLAASALSPAGMQAATAAGKDIQLWNYTGKTEPILLRGHTDTITHLAFDPSGRLLLSAAQDKTVRIWEAHPTGDLSLPGDLAFWSHGLGISSESNEVVVTWDGKVRIVSIESGEVLKEIEAEGTKITTATLVPKTGTVLAVEAEGSVGLLTRHSTEWKWVGKANTGRNRKLVMSRDGRLLLSYEVVVGNIVNFLPLDERSPQSSLLIRRCGGIDEVSLAPDGKNMAVACRADRMQVWDIESLEAPKLSYEFDHDYFYPILFDPTGRMGAAAARDGKVFFWSTAKPQLERLISKQQSSAPYSVVDGLDFSPKGDALISASQDGSVRIWPVVNGRSEVRLIEDADYCCDARFSPDGRYVASYCDDHILLWPSSTAEEPARIRVPMMVTELEFSPDSRFLAARLLSSGDYLWYMRWEDLRSYLTRTRTYCLPPPLRIRYFGEAELQAQRMFERCERHYSRSG